MKSDILHGFNQQKKNGACQRKKFSIMGTVVQTDLYYVIIIEYYIIELESIDNHSGFDN